MPTSFPAHPVPKTQLLFLLWALFVVMHTGSTSVYRTTECPASTSPIRDEQQFAEEYVRAANADMQSCALYAQGI
jgi:hypothetical protein